MRNIINILRLGTEMLSMVVGSFGVLILEQLLPAHNFNDEINVAVSHIHFDVNPSYEALSNKRDTRYRCMSTCCDGKHFSDEINWHHV